MIDLALIVAPQNRNWILHRICREIASVAPERCVVHVWDGTVPPARAVFFSHFALHAAAASLPTVRKARRSVFFTHPPTARRSLLRTLVNLRDVHTIISMSSLHARKLRRAGLSSRVHVAIPGADPDAFRGHDRGGGVVGFCSAYYPRKAPETLLAIVEQTPRERFLLIGRHWNQWSRWSDLEACPNLEYVEPAYGDYPKFYAKMDVFVSPSELEGGPIPLLESMMSNVVPVATATGFAPDLIKPGDNGYLVEVGASAATFRGAISDARSLATNVRATVSHRTWSSFGRQVLELVL